LRIWKAAVTPSIDVLIVFHNSAKFIPPLLDSLKRTSIPFKAYFLDNASHDGTADKLASELEQLPFDAYLLRSLHNNGFARGMNLLARQGNSRYIFMLNPDAELEEGCLDRLFVRAESDHEIAICEARQSPREHPKTYDAATGQTSWCAGAAVLIRRQAFEQVNGFDERIFFMYCEDVDLSWKFWLRGWKCIYVPDAVVRHYTQDVLPGKKRTLENYFTFRNSLFLFYRFGSWADKRVLFNFLSSRFLGRRYSLRSRVLYAFAFADHIRYIPYLFQTRESAATGRHPWIRLNETSLAD
jgi:GT2 family glycosyltransferase